jgi:hypothetical protein
LALPSDPDIPFPAKFQRPRKHRSACQSKQYRLV